MSDENKIVQIRNTPPLNDIVAQLRALADKIEAGGHGEVNTLFAIMPRDGDFPKVFGWGDVHGGNEPIVQLELAKHWLVVNLVSR